jgi:hypothetical protein
MSDEQGFGMAEMLIASALLVLIGGAALGLLGQVEQIASSQTDLQSVLQSGLVSLDLLGRILRQSGNDPCNAGIRGLSSAAANETRVCSDVTGSAAPGDPDKGDPDGDTDDSYEDVVIRYDQSADTVQLVTVGGGVQTVAENISALALEFFDPSGTPVGPGPDASRARITLTSTSRTVSPRTRRPFSLRISSEVQLERHK